MMIIIFKFRFLIFIKYSMNVNVIEFPLDVFTKCHMTLLETISLSLLKRVNPKEIHRFFACNDDYDRLQGYFLVDTYLRVASKISDNS